MTAQVIDHTALLPTYFAAVTVAGVLIVDLVWSKLGLVLATGTIGAVAISLAASRLAAQPIKETFCVEAGCSYVSTGTANGIVIVLCALYVAVLGLSATILKTEDIAVGEYIFLLTCSLAGGIVLAYAGDLITIIVALETLTLPIYLLIAARRRQHRAVEASINYLALSLTAGAVTLLGAALLYAATGTVHLSDLVEKLPTSPQAIHVVAVALIIGGLTFKIAAVPFHGWAPGTYDGAPTPIAAYLSTVSKIGGITALLWIVARGLSATLLTTSGWIIGIIAVTTMTIGNLTALRQTRLVRLIAWSSVAQAGYLIAPFAAFATIGVIAIDTVTATVLAFAVFYVLLEITTFGGITWLRGPRDGGTLDDYHGAARRAPLPGAALIIGLIGLAGLPPGLAGLFAKITIISALAVPVPAVAVIVAINAVIGLMYYLRVCRILLRPSPTPAAEPAPWSVSMTVAFSLGAVIIVGFLPQIVYDLVA